MRASVESTTLPLLDRRSGECARETTRDASGDWSLALRYASVSFHPSDKLLLLYGHALVFRLGLHIVTERVFAGEPVLYVDGANTFDPFAVARLARAGRRRPRQVLAMIHVARAFSSHQVERLVSDCLGAALDRYHARIAMLAGLFETFYSQAVPSHDAARLFDRMMNAITRLTQQGYTIVCLCPSAPILTQAGRQRFDQLRVRADRVLRVQEEQGVVRLQDASLHDGRSWEIPRTLFAER
ncbi:MAG: hypothetical protein P0120_24845 [Nitrospira sp.]|nr:hypothetical protein [Nitrospira sp.]